VVFISKHVDLDGFHQKVVLIDKDCGFDWPKMWISVAKICKNKKQLGPLGIQAPKINK
jgi:hypothetical protein